MKFTLVPQEHLRDKLSLSREDEIEAHVSAGTREHRDSKQVSTWTAYWVAKAETPTAGVDGSGEASETGSFSLFQG